MKAISCVQQSRASFDLPRAVCYLRPTDGSFTCGVRCARFDKVPAAWHHPRARAPRTQIRLLLSKLDFPGIVFSLHSSTLPETLFYSARGSVM